MMDDCGGGRRRQRPRTSMQARADNHRQGTRAGGKQQWHYLGIITKTLAVCGLEERGVNRFPAKSSHHKGVQWVSPPLIFFWQETQKSKSEKREEKGTDGGLTASPFLHAPIIVVLNFFPPCWRHGMARMAIRVSGQRQKHGASLADEIAK